MHWLTAAALALLALIIAPGVSFYFDVTPKVLVLLAAAGVAWTWPRVSWRNPLWVLTGLTAISLALSTHSELGLWGTAWRRFGAIPQVAILLLSVAISTQAHRIVTILRVVSIAGGITAVYGIAQYFGFDPLLPAAGYHIGEGVWTIVRPPSTLGYVSYFATWLLFVMFLSLAVPGRLYQAIAGLAAVAMLLTGTRAAMLGAVAGLLVRGVLRSRDRSLTVAALWRRRKVGVVAAGVVVLAVAFLLSPAGLQLRSRARWFAEDPWGGARPLLWRDSLRMAMARPLTGYGIESFTAQFPHYESRDLARAYPDFAHESAHNIFLDTFVAQGVAGLLLLAGLCVLGLRAAWLARTKHPRIAVALASALAAAIVAQQFTVFTIPTAAIFFATIALAAGLHDPPATIRRRIPFALPLLLATVHYASEDHALAVTRRALDAGTLPAPPPAADLWYSRALINAVQKFPDIRQRMQAVQEATGAARRATTTAEDPFNAWYSLAGILAARNDAAGTEQALRAAITARPNWFKPHWTLAQLLLMEGRGPELVKPHARWIWTAANTRKWLRH